MAGRRGADETGNAADLIDAKIAALGDWRGERLARFRALIKRPIRTSSRR